MTVERFLGWFLRVMLQQTTTDKSRMNQRIDLLKHPLHPELRQMRVNITH